MIYFVFKDNLTKRKNVLKLIKQQIMSRNLNLLLVFLLSALYGFGQQNVCLGDDADVCEGESVQIENCGGLQLPGGGVVIDNPTTVSLSDDRWSGLIPIGFNFSFYGTTYSNCVIGSNAVISFDASKAGNSHTWSLTSVGPMPNNNDLADARNAAMLCYSDINPNSGGEVFYKTIGTAPNREFYVVYSNVPTFGASDCNYLALILFEGSNNIEYHISSKTMDVSWNGGLAIQGVQNAAGTVATTTPGRNVSQWTAANDGQLFKPTSPTNTNAYTNSTIPYKLMLSGNASFEWEDEDGVTYPYNNGVLNVNNVPAGTKGYFLTVSANNCNSQVGAVSATSYITGLTSSVAATSEADICSAGIGKVNATPTGGVAPYTYVWTGPGLGATTTKTVNNVFAGTYTVKMSDVNGCESTASVTVGDTPATYPASLTPVSCPGGSDGTATVEMSPMLGNVTYLWNDGQTTSTATGLSEGIYECVVTSDIGCSNTVQLAIGEVPAMEVQVTNQEDVTCNSGDDGIATISVTKGNAPYSYTWTGSNSVGQTADDLAFGTTTVTITDSKGCVATEDINIGQPAPLSIDAISKDTIICIADSVELFVNVTGGSSDYIYEWTSNGQVVGNENVIHVTPTAASTEYCVTITEECGSPSTSACMMVNYPADVEPGLTPDKTGECFPIEVNFDNITNTTETVDYTVWNYNDGDSDTIPGLDAAVHEFGKGIFDVRIEVVTDRGCRYFKNYPKLIEGYAYPKPNFYISPNPASMYEPTVNVFSQSSTDIISHEWYAVGADPDYSTLKDPTFKYPSEIMNYPLVLVVENSFGCIDSIQKLVRIENEVLLFAPNSFTPDGNGFNDKWRVEVSGVDLYNFHLEVFNRWGEKVFESFDPEAYWDGTYGNKVIRDGSYIWKISALDYETDAKYEFKGAVNIIK